MNAATVQLVVCVVLALIGLVVAGVSWRRGRRGRVIQGVGLIVLPVALYLSGLLTVVLDFVAAVVAWAVRVVFSPMIWTGISLLGLSIVLLVVGGIVAGRGKARAKEERKAAKAQGQVSSGGRPAVGAGSTVATTSTSKTSAKGKNTEPVDPELDEIEALLKSRGIE